MKKRFNFKKIWFLALLLSLIAFVTIAVTSCNKPNEVHHSVSKLSGTWSFTITPLESVQDTSLVKGIRGSEEEEYPSVIDKVYLYENKTGEIIGDHGFTHFSGSRSENNVILNVYSRADGHVDPEATADQMNHVSTMTLTIDDFGNMKGNGIYLENPDYDYAQEESYTVMALKRSDITNDYGTTKQGENVSFSLCDVAASIDSWIISTMSDNVFRPIGNCYNEKDGGGYYVFGRYGPGSLLPIYTQTVYYPLEWSWCKVRRYGFDIDLRGNVRAVEALKWAVAHQAPTNNFNVKLGFETLDGLNDAIDDFENKYGGFAISFGYSLRTHNLSIYVNHSKGNSSDAKNHILVTSIAGAVDSYVNKIYYFAGANISDHWYLRRSDFDVCNTPLLFCYVIGTNEVEYN